MTPTPRFSIVVPTYNRPELLVDALASIQAQTVTDFECIVVDDASDTAHAVIPQDERFKLVALTSNVGGTKARHIGCEHARGEVLCFLDDDDAWAPNRLDLAVTGLQRAPLSICWSRPLDRPHAAPSGRRLEGLVSEVIAETYTPPMATVAIRRDRFKSFDIRIRACEDIDWWIRQASDTPVTTTPEVGFLHRSHAGVRNMNGIDVRIESSRQLLRIHEQHFSQYPRAHGFRWERIGIMSARVGEVRAARRAFSRSLRIRPSARVLRHLLRTYWTRDRLRVGNAAITSRSS